MVNPGQILALDLARRSGWALGYPSDEYPESGSIEWAKPSASMAAVFSSCRADLANFLAMHPEIRTVVFEAPLNTSFLSGPRRPQTERMLIGITAVVEELLYSIGKYDVREATVADVRRHFIGGNPVRAVAKERTIAKCHRLGWKPQDDNAADALALWHYQASIFDPELAIQTSPLFARKT